MPPRSLVLLAAGALTGLALAGHALFTAPASTVAKIPQGAIALVNHRQILLSDYRNQIQAMYEATPEKASPAQRKAVLDSMVSEELLVQRGLEIDLPATDPGVREALVAGVQLTSAADIEGRKPSEAELKAWFTTHRNQYTSNGAMTLRNLVAPIGAGQSAAQALSIAQRAVLALRKGMTAGDVVATYGLKEAGPAGGQEQMDIAVARALGEALFVVARRLANGEISDPVAMPAGVHVLLMVRRRPESPLEFDTVRERVATDLKRDAVGKAHAEYAQFLRGKAQVLLAPGIGE